MVTMLEGNIIIDLNCVYTTAPSFISKIKMKSLPTNAYSNRRFLKPFSMLPGYTIPEIRGMIGLEYRQYF